MNAVAYRTFLRRLISMLSFILCRFLVAAPNFFVWAMHKIAGSRLHTSPTPGIMSILLLSHEALGILDIQ